MCAYCAPFRVFGPLHFYGDRRGVAPIPPEAGSVKAVTLILLWSLITHLVSTSVIAASTALYSAYPLVTLPAWAVADPYSTIIGGPAIRLQSLQIAELLAIALLQGAVSIWLVHRWFARKARFDNLPRWLYGWSAHLANLQDDDDKAVVIWVLTTTDLGPGVALAYSGQLRDLSLKAYGAIVSVGLSTCERYAVDLTTPDFAANNIALSTFGDLTIEGSQIRNFAIEVIFLSDLEAYENEAEHDDRSSSHPFSIEAMPSRS